MSGLTADISNPAISSTVSEGYYLFPMVKFKCSGHILGVQGRIHIEEDYYYRNPLLLTMQLWQENQDHYITRGRNYTISLSIDDESAEFPDAIPSSTSGLYYFPDSRTVTLPYTFDNAISVEAGDVLGIYLPPTEMFADNVVITGIPLVLADSPAIGIRGPTPCWSPTQRRYLCHPLLPFTGVPLLSFDFKRSLVMTGKPSDMLYMH